jgi:hypothetical protein
MSVFIHRWYNSTILSWSTFQLQAVKWRTSVWTIVRDTAWNQNTSKNINITVHHTVIALIAFDILTLFANNFISYEFLNKIFSGFRRVVLDTHSPPFITHHTAISFITE